VGPYALRTAHSPCHASSQATRGVCPAAPAAALALLRDAAGRGWPLLRVRTLRPLAAAASEHASGRFCLPYGCLVGA
jgi:hypothetical protein